MNKKLSSLFALCIVVALIPTTTIYAESHIIPPTKHPLLMEIPMTKKALCLEDLGTVIQLSPTKEGEYEDYAWFKYYNGKWSLLDTASITISDTLPNTLGDTVWYYFTSVRIFNSRIENGDFEKGNVGFTSAYDYKTPAGNQTLYPESSYTITNSISAVHTSAPTACDHDHTTGKGKMMVVNGDVGKGKIVWEQTVRDLLPNTQYLFSAWVMNWDQENANYAQLEFSINGQLQGEVFSPKGGYGKWTRLQTIWKSGKDTIATIKLVNQQSASYGNDFAIDDINFQQMEIYEQMVQYTFSDCYCIADRVYSKWDDVLFCDNHDDAFVAYQWYCNEIEMEGATRQYVTCVNDPSLKYYCLVTQSDGEKVRTCPIYFSDAPRSADTEMPKTTPKKIMMDGLLYIQQEETIYNLYGMPVTK